MHFELAKNKQETALTFSFSLTGVNTLGVWQFSKTFSWPKIENSYGRKIVYALRTKTFGGSCVFAIGKVLKFPIALLT